MAKDGSRHARLPGIALALLSASALIETAGEARAQVTSRVSVGSAGVQGNSWSFGPSISADGRFVAFHSTSSNLVSADTNDTSDVFVHDRLTGATVRVSVSSAGIQANGGSDSPSITADGRHVAFTSAATNLVPGDASGNRNVFVHDIRTGQTARVSVDSGGVPGNAWSDSPSISADGRFVAFESPAGNLVIGDTNAASDVFVHDRRTGVTSRVSVDSQGNQGDSLSATTSISGDGRFVAFSSYASNLVPGDMGATLDVFVHDRRTGQTSRTSVDSAGIPADGLSANPSVSADGRVVAFWSIASNLVSDDTNGVEDVFVRDTRTGETSRVSVDLAGLEGNGLSIRPKLSAGGRYVSFTSYATNLVPNDSNGGADVFIHDRLTGDTVRVSVHSTGTEGNGEGAYHSVSADGRFVAFDSYADNLVPGDSNGVYDVFIRDVGGCHAGTVNDGAGYVSEVLFVNDSTGGLERTVRLVTYQPLTIFVAAPPSASGLAPFALYAWLYEPVPGAPAFTLPFAIGETCLPTPLTGGVPWAVWNNTSSSLAGIPTHASSPAPSIVVQLPRGLRRPATAYLQGIIRDRAALNGRASVTNGLTIEVR